MKSNLNNILNRVSIVPFDWLNETHVLPWWQFVLLPDENKKVLAQFPWSLFAVDSRVFLVENWIIESHKNRLIENI